MFLDGEGLTTRSVCCVQDVAEKTVSVGRLVCGRLSIIAVASSFVVLTVWDVSENDLLLRFVLFGCSITTDNDVALRSRSVLGGF